MLIALGFVKKCVIADYLAETLVNRVFEQPLFYSGAEVLAGVYAYAVQIYCDFSGYSDIAIGAALLLGFRLKDNFKSPYRAASLAEFWQRWHISFSTWLRDYVFFSLPGVRKKAVAMTAIVATFVLGGLWHGASWCFLLWGLIHGLGLAVERLFEAKVTEAVPALEPPPARGAHLPRGAGGLGVLPRRQPGDGLADRPAAGGPDHGHREHPGQGRGLHGPGAGRPRPCRKGGSRRAWPASPLSRPQPRRLCWWEPPPWCASPPRARSPPSSTRDSEMDRRAQPWLVSALVVLAAAVPYFRPALANYRIASPAQLRRNFLAPFQGRPAVPVWEPLVNLESLPEPVPTKAVGTASAQAEATLPEPRATQAGPVFTGPLLEDPTDSLRAFHEALLRSEQGQHVVRISHFGDSPITGDLISGEARQRFQRLYGDAGHGWILPGRPWEWYGHLGVTLEDEGWTIHSPAAACSRDRAYGFGGASFSTRGVATTRLTTAKQAPFQRLELHYLAQPKGGSLQLKVDGEVSTALHPAGGGRTRRGNPRLTEDATHSVSLRDPGRRGGHSLRSGPGAGRPRRGLRRPGRQRRAPSAT